MTSDFECRMVDYDDDDEWHTVEAQDAEDAASLYAGDCHFRSGSEILALENETETVVVRDSDGNQTKWEVSPCYDYRILVNEVLP